MPKILFDEKEAKNLQKKAINFVNKVKEIIDSTHLFRKKQFMKGVLVNIKLSDRYLF